MKAENTTGLKNLRFSTDNAAFIHEKLRDIPALSNAQLQYCN